MKSGRMPSQTTTTTYSALPAANAAAGHSPPSKRAQRMARMRRTVFKSYSRGSNEKVGKIETNRKIRTGSGILNEHNRFVLSKGMNTKCESVFDTLPWPPFEKGSATVSVAESGVAPDFRSASISFVRRLRKTKFSARRRKPRARRPRSPERHRPVVALQCRPAAPSGRLGCSGVPQRALGYDHFLLKGLEKVR